MDTLRLIRTAGAVAELVKKFLRDEELDANSAQSCLHEALCTWHLLGDQADLTAQEVLEHNMQKLEGRAQRGTQSGSGDDR